MLLQQPQPVQKQRILVTGATGYIGGRLVPRLLERGYRVRCLARDPRKLAGRWSSTDAALSHQSDNSEGAPPAAVEVVCGDVLDPGSLDCALEGVDAAFYLIHAMGSGGPEFAQRERDGARAFAEAAAKSGVQRIVFLGGLGQREYQPSAHLRSRHATGDVLRAGSVPVTELRAAMIVGSGSAAFEMLRHLTEKLPVMVCPRWVENRTQPVFINDALAYLIAALECPEAAGRVLDIGGPDVLSYRQMMQTFAEVRGLKRAIITVPVLTPHLSAYWINLVTPIPASIAFPLVEGLKSETVCENDEAQKLLGVPLTPFREALARALADTDARRVPTRWSGTHRGGGLPRPFDETTLPERGLLKDEQVVTTNAAAPALRTAISRIGGDAGWYYADWLWDIRGAIDRVFGGAGVRRGRRHPDQVSVGDAIDFWRVEDYGPERMLLRAEMKVPGSAWLGFRIRDNDDGTRSLVQSAYYLPGSLWGYLYWYLLAPVHFFVFAGMAREIVRWAERMEAPGGAGEVT